MKSLKLANLCVSSTFLTLSNNALSTEVQALVDDFSNLENNNLGIKRQFLDDKMAGGSTQVEIDIADGKLNVKGEIVPPRGQPGWASSLFLLNPEGLPQDVSRFEGVKLLVKLHSGNISVSANSTEVTNYDYHAAMVIVQPDNKYHEIKIPFNTMKRAWSEQTQLNTATINSLSIVSFGMQKTPFEFEIDNVGFY